MTRCCCYYRIRRALTEGDTVEQPHVWWHLDRLVEESHPVLDALLVVLQGPQEDPQEEGEYAELEEAEDEGAAVAVEVNGETAAKKL